MPRTPEPRPDEPIKIIYDGQGNARYQAVVTTTPVGMPRKQSRRNFDTLRKARDFVESTRTKVREGTFQARDKTSLRQLGELWLASRSRPRQRSLDDYAKDLQRVCGDRRAGKEIVPGAHGDRPVQALTTAELQTWVNAWPRTGGILGKGLSPRSVRFGIQRLRQVLDHGVALGIIRTNPADGLEAPAMTLEEENTMHRRKVSTAVWTFAHLQAFVRAADEDELAVAWRLSAAGLRRSEVLGLDWSCVDLATGRIHICQARPGDKVERVKAKLSRGTLDVEAMVPGTLALLKELWLAHGRPETNTVRIDRDGRPYGGRQDHLLVLDRAGRPVHRDHYSRVFQSISHEAGLPRIKLHAIRHTIATELHDRGVPAATGAALLRHSVQTHLASYVKSTAGQQEAAAAAFAAAWRDAV